MEFISENVTASPLLAEICAADREVKSGHYLRDEGMRGWLLSWGTDHELLPPKCACGAQHDDKVE